LRVTPTADQLHRNLCKTFWQDPTTLVTINEIYLSLTRRSKTIDEGLYGVDNEPRLADGTGSARPCDYLKLDPSVK
jgi:hypothetical protein